MRRFMIPGGWIEDPEPEQVPEPPMQHPRPLSSGEIDAQLIASIVKESVPEPLKETVHIPQQHKQPRRR